MPQIGRHVLLIAVTRSYELPRIHNVLTLQNITEHYTRKPEHCLYINVLGANIMLVRGLTRVRVVAHRDRGNWFQKMLVRGLTSVWLTATVATGFKRDTARWLAATAGTGFKRC